MRVTHKGQVLPTWFIIVVVGALWLYSKDVQAMQRAGRNESIINPGELQL